MFQLSAQSSRRVKLPPNDMLCDPFSQLNVSSIVVRNRVALRRVPRPPPGCASVRPKPEADAKPPWLLNMSVVALSKNPSGDDCQPPRSSLTIDDDSVDRSVIEPRRASRHLIAVRREAREALASALFSVSGVLLNAW